MMVFLEIPSSTSMCWDDNINGRTSASTTKKKGKGEEKLGNVGGWVKKILDYDYSHFFVRYLATATWPTASITKSTYRVTSSIVRVFSTPSSPRRI